MRQARPAHHLSPIRQDPELPAHAEELAKMIAKPLSAATRRWLDGAGSGGRAARGIMQIQGMLRGKPHRVLIAGAKQSLSVTLQALQGLASLKSRLKSDAVFLFVSRKIRPEDLITASELGVFLVLDGSKGRVPQIHFGKAMLVQYRAVDSWALSLELADTSRGGIAFDQASRDLTFRGKPVRNWLSRKSRRLLQAVECDGIERSKFHFRRPLEMACEGKTLKVRSLDILFSCRILHRIHFRQSALPDSEYFPLRGEVGGLFKSQGKSAGGKAGAPDSRCERSAQITGFPGRKPDLFVYVPIETAGTAGVPDLDRFVTSDTHH